MFCGNCGKELEEGALFCKYCGAKTEKPQKEIEIERPDTEMPKNSARAEQTDGTHTAGNKRFKKTGLAAAGIILLVCAAAAGFVLVQWAKAAEAFSDKAAAFKNYCEDFRLGDLEEDYEALLEEADQIIEKKDRAAYKDAEGEFEQFKEKLQTYITEIEQYSGRREEYAKLKEYILTDEQKGRYESLLAELEKALRKTALQALNNP